METILKQIASSSWQPKFKFTDNMDLAIDSILRGHEDYFLNLHQKVIDIISDSVFVIQNIIEDEGKFTLTFADVCNWQKQLFEHKKELINYHNDKNPQQMLAEKCKNLPNQYINLGLRKANVKVGDWTPPEPLFLDDLKGMSFPIIVEESKIHFTILRLWLEHAETELILDQLTTWYKIFETIHFFEDLNGRLGGIVINILSYLTTNKFIIIIS